MKKTVCILVSLALLILSIPCVSAETNDKVKTSAQSYILYCADNGEILAGENIEKTMKPASTTKIMTTLLTLEYAASANKSVKFTEQFTAEGSSMYLKIGDVVTLKDLAAGMMMASGNDAANAAAISIAGSSEKFAEMMNTKASQIGMKNTHFVTPSGLDDEEHYTTAYDMALLMSYALENEDFAELTSQKSVAVDFIKPSGKRNVYNNHNKLLSRYEHCIGGKTGFTKAAGRCLVSAAKKDGLTLVCVTFNDGDDWNDHEKLFDYGFSKLTTYSSADSNICFDVKCVGSSENNVSVMGEKDAFFVIDAENADKVRRTVYIDSFLYAPLKANETVGKIEYTINGKLVYSVGLVCANEVKAYSENKNIFTIIKDLFTYG